MTSPDEQLASSLAMTLESYAAKDSESGPPPKDGWHPGARIGATVQRGLLLAYNDSGADGICNLDNGRGTWLNFEGGGHSRDFTGRPYSVWRWMPSYNDQPAWLAGALAPHAAKLELVSEDGTAVLADVVDHTFAVELGVDMECLRDAKERLEAHPSDSDEGRADFSKLMADSRAEMSKVMVKVYDRTDTLLYEGPSINSTDD